MCDSGTLETTEYAAELHHSSRAGRTGELGTKGLPVGKTRDEIKAGKN